MIGSMRDDAIIRGIATILWGDAWANHVEAHGCVNLSGKEITSLMPEIPDLAWEHAIRIAGRIEERTGFSLYALLDRARRADEIADDVSSAWVNEHAERFGECLAWAAFGAGVGWEDDHRGFAALDKVDDTIADCGGVSLELQGLTDEGCGR